MSRHLPILAIGLLLSALAPAGNDHLGGAITMNARPRPEPAPDPEAALHERNDRIAIRLLAKAFEEAINKAVQAHEIRIGGGWCGNFRGTSSTCADIVGATQPYFDAAWKEQRKTHPGITFDRVKPVTLLYEGPGTYDLYPFQHIYFGVSQGRKISGIIDPWAFGDGKLRPYNRSVVYTVFGLWPNRIIPIAPLR